MMEIVNVSGKDYVSVGEFLLDPIIMDNGSTLLITVNKPGCDPEEGPCVDIWVKPDLTTTFEHSGGIE